MGNLAEIDALKKKILSVRAGSTKKHYKVSIGEICDILMRLLEQIELFEQHNSPSIISTTSMSPTFETIIKGNDTNSPETSTDIPPENN